MYKESYVINNNTYHTLGPFNQYTTFCQYKQQIKKRKTQCGEKSIKTL